MIAIGLASIGTLLFALLDDPPHLMAAGLSAALGWLVCYAYMLQRDCWRLARNLESDHSKQPGKGYGDKQRQAESSEAAPLGGGMDLDVTSLARSLGNPFGTALGAMALGPGQSGQTMQAVCTAALVNEFLRCAKLLQEYKSRHGTLPNAPDCNPGFAEALLSGLHGSGTMTQSAHAEGAPGSPTPARDASKGTPNFADRLASAKSETSPVPMRISPATEAQKAAIATGKSSISSQEANAPDAASAADLFGQNSSPAASSVAPPPSAAELDRCNTIDLAPGLAAATSPAGWAVAEASEGGQAPVARSSARTGESPGLGIFCH